MVLLLVAAPFSCTKPVAADSTPPEKKDTTHDDPSKDNPQTPEPPAEWDGKTFIDRTAEWQAEFKEYPGANNSTYWTFEIATCTTKYHLVKFVCEGEDYYAPSDICHSPVNIASAYNFFCVDVDESYLMNALQTRLPDWDEIAWVTGMGHAQGYAFGFNEDKKFTGEYAHITSEHVF